MTKPKFSIVDDDKERRMCVLPEWDGTGNQYILDGSCTAEHALQLYRDYYAQPGHGAQEIIDVNPAIAAGKLVWLPITVGLRQVGAQLRGENGKLREHIKTQDNHIITLDVMLAEAQKRATRQGYISMALGIAIACFIVLSIIIK